MIDVLITAPALDTALCLTGVSPRASAPAQGHHFTSVYSQREASVLFLRLQRGEVLGMLLLYNY